MVQTKLLLVWGNFCGRRFDDLLYSFLLRVKSADDIDEQYSDGEDDEHEDDLSPPFSKKSKSKRKTGRWPKWNNDDVNGMVNIVVNSDYYKRKLVFTNTKNGHSGEIYERIKKN